MKTTASETQATSRILIGRFHSLDPVHHASQSDLHARLASLHAKALSQASQELTDQSQELRSSLEKRLSRYGCDSSRISQRHFEVPAFQPKSPETPGPSWGWDERMQIYRTALDRAFLQWYPDQGDSRPPADLLHVSCTGYIAPSPAQTRMADLQHADVGTRVTHLYHMGCYAALPALRVAEGLLRAGSRLVDITHTELCTLHLQVGRTDPEQLVIQSLFGDGHIRWSTWTGDPRGETDSFFELLGHHEQLVPGTSDRMSWSAGNTGWEMTLARDVPEQIQQALPKFIEHLLNPHGLRLGDCITAIHPGGPRIIDQLAAGLSLSEEQVRYSREILFERGNMSSATLPHIWDRIAGSPHIKNTAPVLSLAFGPGLTLCGSLMLLHKRDRELRS